MEEIKIKIKNISKEVEEQNNYFELSVKNYEQNYKIEIERVNKTLENWKSKYDQLKLKIFTE